MFRKKSEIRKNELTFRAGVSILKHVDKTRGACVPVSYTHLDVYKRQAMNYVDVYQKNQEYPHTELLKLLGV